eukprot:CAMPEP_0204873162 /NCGR_PEP_ID=MMETSP1348-20121228/39874_1 /ASSEMBLY_ACC=CAM_ASM_000700 /TAXON_ID=215587 /ORGANISM="Aplanochytrium stocchinoi, Strain GSBS06" /LENGTH=668 /DNA_ID=CAMNT_0052028347 /DNA_START=253 /DNA_END=2259 /DNA_ORIENTATION=+
MPNYDVHPSSSDYFDFLWTLGIGDNADEVSLTNYYMDLTYPFPRSKWLKELKNDVVNISHKSISFWYHPSLVGVNSTLVAGVTSNAYAKKRRDAIRETWGLDYQGRRVSVFFIVAKENGRWPVEEAAVHGDMILIDIPIGTPISTADANLPFKSQVWFYAANKYAAFFDFILKTEDDSFVDFEGLTSELELSMSMSTSQKNYIYWGSCNEQHCDNSGYVLSRNALDCMLSAEHLNELPEEVNEAVVTGLLADRCGIKPTSYGSKLVYDGKTNHVSQSGAVFHYVRLIYTNMSIKRIYQYDLMYKIGGKKWKPGKDISRFRAGYFENYEKENENYFARIDPFNSAPMNMLSKPYPFPVPLGETTRMLNVRVMISGRRISYWYPSTLEHINNSLVIGVLSGPGNSARRDDVRKTWAKNFLGRKENNIFFLVAREDGEWPMEEAIVFSDIIFLDIEEAYNTVNYSSLPFKSQVWFHLVNTRVAHTEFLLKTDDDAFVDVDGLTRQLQSYKLYLQKAGKKRDLYWGNCLPKNHQIVIRDETSKWYVSQRMFNRDFYPPYCIGGGYVLSKGPGLDCMTKRLNQISHLTLEDAATGVLAEMCNVEPVGYFNEMVNDITTSAGLRYMRLVYHKLESDKLWQFNALYKQGRKRWRVRNKIRRFRDGFLEKYVDVRL